MSKKNLWLIALAVIVVIGGFFYAKSYLIGSCHIEKGQYQAVFLTNDQVYFGKMKKISWRNLVLENVYYLRVDQQLQASEEEQQSSPEISLVKLGSELHGPEDKMIVSYDKILFWENLKDDSRVVEAIRNYQSH